MKKIILFIFIVYTAITVKAQWETVYFQNLPLLNAVRFKDFNNGIAVGSGFAVGPSFGIILRTINNGTTWDTVLITNKYVDFRQVAYTSDSTIIAVGSPGFIAKSVDNGNNWDTASYTNCLMSLSFPSQNIGYVGGCNGMIYKTINEGATWSPIPTSYPDYIYSLAFINDTVGFAVTDSLILKTTNGGISWSSTNMHRWGHQICFPSDNVGYFFIDNIDSVKVYKTVNMGVNWSLHSTTPSNNFMVTMFFVNDNIGYMGGFFQIQKTVDGGLTWTQQTCDHPFVSNAYFYDWIGDIYFLNQNVGFATGYEVFYRVPNSSITNIEQIQNNACISIYPNPSTGLINIIFAEKTTDSKLEVLNFCGQVLLSKEINNSTQTTLDLSNHAKGMYFIKVHSGSGVVVRKVVISE